MQYLGGGLANGAGVDAFIDPASDFAQLALAIARSSANQVLTGRSVADDFQDTDGVDASASTNELYVSTGTKGFHAVRATSSVFANNMTSNTAPSPQVVSSTSEYVGYEAWKAADSDTTTSYFDTASPGFPFYWRRRLDTARVVTKYKVQCGGDGAPSHWTFRGSNDGSSWTTLDTQTSQNPGSSVGSAIEYTISNTTAYLYYELLITNGTSYGSLRDVSFTVTTPLGAMSLRSIAFTALTAPSTALLTIQASTASGTITPNTNLIGYVSRDNGTTWTAAALTAGPTVAGVTTYEGPAVISSQPSGTNMKWRIDTDVTGSADISIDGVCLRWG